MENDDDNDSGWDTDLDDSEEYTENYDPHKSSKDRYVAACKECGVIPASYFLRNMNNVRLNMAHHGFGVKGIQALSIALLTNTHLTGLDLCDNSLGSDGISYLCEMLAENIFITDLDVSENLIGLEGVTTICETLKQADTLKRLTLAGNSLETKSAIILSEAIKDNTGLRYLNLSHNIFGEEAGLHFGPAIALNEYLEEIDLSWNHLRQKGACAIGKALKENTTLRKLNLSWNGFSDDGMYVLADALKINPALQQLDISSNRITHIGAGHLQKGLAVNEGLLVLKLGQNPLQHGPIFILNGINANASTTLTELDLTDIQVTSEFIDLLAKMTDSQLRVYHGGLGGCPTKAAERPKPMKVLRDYIKNNQMRVFDFFKTMDKDKSMSISIPELVHGLKESGVPLRNDELFALVRSLDLDGDGEIDYKEMLIGHQEAQKEERVEISKEKADKARKRHLSQNLKPGTPLGGLSKVSDSRRPDSRTGRNRTDTFPDKPSSKRPSSSGRPSSDKPSSRPASPSGAEYNLHER